MDLLDKYYRVYCQVNLDNIYENVVNIRKNINDDTALCAVIKMDGYGHGAVPVAEKIDSIVDAYAVATVDEGINLRKNGITKPIVILGFTYEKRIRGAIKYDIRMAVFEYETAVLINKCAKEMGKVAKVHIKVDTGMSRIGFKDDDAAIDDIVRINALENIEIEGIFTHFAKADENDKSNALSQMRRFDEFNEKLAQKGVEIGIKHCSNSAGIIDIKEANHDAVRLGISLYGLYPSDEVDKNRVSLKPVLQLKSHIVYIKEIEAGTPVSYGGTFVADKKMRIATIPVGYGDGYPRSLSNKGYVLINGKKAPILGRVCMDQFMVDVTDIETKKGDLVTLVGEDNGAFLSVEEVSMMAGTFNYEFICDVGKRVPRVYISDGEIIGGKDYFDDDYQLTT
ncbi:MAG: alanine racemase [Lachnospiraceae bacterium]|nr:alanine racemase [Lachnospiraceae bacterium]